MTGSLPWHQWDSRRCWLVTTRRRRFLYWMHFQLQSLVHASRPALYHFAIGRIQSQLRFQPPPPFHFHRAGDALSNISRILRPPTTTSLSTTNYDANNHCLLTTTLRYPSKVMGHRLTRRI
ncbi:hypothetical protein BDR07DRAFT_285317 [Suillus spraguei]|nr:hypothetical protein BDR07DRAFT_285317 [Suillus spraguei]